MVELNEETRWILGRPCFSLIGIANDLRAGGFEIKRKAEDEQAACLYWMLCMYENHGPKWREVAERQLKEYREQSQGKTGDGK